MKLLNVDSIAEVKEKLEKYFGAERNGRALETVCVPLHEVAGAYLAADIFADADMPAFDRSVVDGYAVKAADTFGAGDATPAFLEVAGEVQMGQACHSVVTAGLCMYIPTGGMLPVGADATVMIEYTEKLDEGSIAIYKSVSPGGGIVKKGDDFKKGELLFKKGQRLTVKDIGLLAAIGKTEILAYRKPNIAILSTGDEIISPNEVPTLGQIRDINAHAIAAYAKEAGAYATNIEIVKDDFDMLKEKVGKCLDVNDIVILSGGSSAGTKDMTSAVINSLGSPGVFTHGISMKPGKPTIIGSAQGKAVFGLPGHPLAAILVYKIVVEDYMKRYFFGANLDEEQKIVFAKVTENIHSGEGRETYQLVELIENKEDPYTLFAKPIHGKSGGIKQLSKAAGYIKIGANEEGLDVGKLAKVVLF